MNKKRHQMKRQAHGFSMIELLVAVLVMGVGVLGVTGLQMVSLQNNRDALLRTEALQMAYDILDRIRVNPGAGVPGAIYDGVAFDDTPSNPPDCFANNCSSDQIADFDIALWQCALGGNNEDDVCVGLRDNDFLPPLTAQPGLPEGAGQIAVDGAGNITVSVQWRGFGDNLQTVNIASRG